MKKHIIMLAAGAMALVGCNKDLPQVYEDRTGVIYIQKGVLAADLGKVDTTNEKGIEDSLSISFLEHPGMEYTFALKLMTRGLVDFDNDRHYTVRVLTDAPSDPEYVVATEDEYELGEMIIPKGQEYGLLSVTVKKSERMINDGVKVELALELVPNDAFAMAGNDPGTKIEEGKERNLKTKYEIKYLATYTRPNLWGFGGASFGTYSNEKYMLLLDACIEAFGTIDIIPWGDTSIATMPTPGKPDWGTMGPIINYCKAAATQKLLEYKAKSDLDPDAYPPYYYPGTTTWIAY